MPRNKVGNYVCDGVFETLIGDPVTTGGNHRCIFLVWEKASQGRGSIL